MALARAKTPERKQKPPPDTVRNALLHTVKPNLDQSPKPGLPLARLMKRYDLSSRLGQADALVPCVLMGHRFFPQLTFSSQCSSSILVSLGTNTTDTLYQARRQGRNNRKRAQTPRTLNPRPQSPNPKPQTLISSRPQRRLNIHRSSIVDAFHARGALPQH